MSNEEKKLLCVIVCRPGERAAIEEIGEDLASMQAVVGGMIQEYQPFYDEADPRIENVTEYSAVVRPLIRTSGTACP